MRTILGQENGGSQNVVFPVLNTTESQKQTLEKPFHCVLLWDLLLDLHSAQAGGSLGLKEWVKKRSFLRENGKEGQGDYETQAHFQTFLSIH
jgi:hypothetical protein